MSAFLRSTVEAGAARRPSEGATLSVAKGGSSPSWASGCGKTTVLRTVVGLGFRRGIDVDRRLRPGRRPAGEPLPRGKVGMSSSTTLFDHLAVLDNVTLAPPVVAARARAAEERALAASRRWASTPTCGHFRASSADRRGASRSRARSRWSRRSSSWTSPPRPGTRPPQRAGRSLVDLVSGQGRTLVVATHDDDLVRDFATRVVVMADGVVVEDGPPARVPTHPQHPATRFLLQTKDRLPAAAAPAPKPRAPRVPKGRAPLA